jgi:hypothetical protein
VYAVSEDGRTPVELTGSFWPKAHITHVVHIREIERAVPSPLA